eukprot:Lithocolla_globosa_v1_NODE_503_length_3880_cov_6.757908.p1 type:complete len:1237 gc:universal NODE_503_length_3880_cov_6.757908:86-3796(+)
MKSSWVGWVLSMLSVVNATLLDSFYKLTLSESESSYYNPGSIFHQVTGEVVEETVEYSGARSGGILTIDMETHSIAIQWTYSGSQDMGVLSPMDVEVEGLEWLLDDGDCTMVLREVADGIEYAELWFDGSNLTIQDLTSIGRLKGESANSGFLFTPQCVCHIGFAGLPPAIPEEAACTACKDLGSYQDQPGQDSCKQCPIGSTTTNSDKISDHDSLSDCLCLSGYYGSMGNCSVCPGGSYATTTNTTTCQLCPSPSTTTGGEASDHDSLSDCTGCTEGWVGEGPMDCEACPEDTYEDKIDGVDRCVECPEGTNTLGMTAAPFVSFCEACSLGYAGFGPASCITCDEGLYQDQPNQATCKLCPEGTTTLPDPSPIYHDNADDCSVCLQGYENTPPPCSVCATDFYRDSLDGGCLACPIGGRTEGVEAQDHDSMEDCLLEGGYYGSYQECPSGFYCPGHPEDVKFACPANSLSGPKSSSVSNCVCSSGYFVDGSGTCSSCGADCLVCGGIDFCVACLPSFFLFDGECLELCPLNYFADGTTCMPCDPSCYTCSGGLANACMACSGGNILSPPTPPGRCLEFSEAFTCPAEVWEAIEWPQTVSGDSYTSSCEEGFYGQPSRTCLNNEWSEITNPCQSCGGNCSLCLDDTSCQTCFPGYRLSTDLTTGHSSCNTTCQTNALGCQFGGTCQLQCGQGSQGQQEQYVCICVDGYEGEYCEIGGEVPLVESLFPQHQSQMEPCEITELRIEYQTSVAQGEGVLEIKNKLEKETVVSFVGTDKKWVQRGEGGKSLVVNLGDSLLCNSDASYQVTLDSGFAVGVRLAASGQEELGAKSRALTLNEWTFSTQSASSLPKTLIESPSIRVDLFLAFDPETNYPVDESETFESSLVNALANILDANEDRFLFLGFADSISNNRKRLSGGQNVIKLIINPARDYLSEPSPRFLASRMQSLHEDQPETITSHPILGELSAVTYSSRTIWEDNWYYVLALVGGFLLLLLLMVGLKLIYGKNCRTFVLAELALSTADLTTDILFAVSLTGTQMSFLIPYCWVFVILPICVNWFLAILFLKTFSSFRNSIQDNRTSLTILLMLSGITIDFLKIFESGLTSNFSHQFSSLQRETLKIWIIFPLLLENLTQIILQLIFFVRVEDITFISIVSITLSATSLLFLLTRWVLRCIFPKVSKKIDDTNEYRGEESGIGSERTLNDFSFKDSMGKSMMVMTTKTNSLFSGGGSELALGEK